METQHLTEEIARILGITPHGISRFILSDALSKGLPMESLDSVRHLISPDRREFETLIVPAGTLKRRRRQKAPLSPHESERLERVARVWAMARDVYKTDEDARRFLGEPHGLLRGRKPIDLVIANDVGAVVVEDILGRLKYGSAA